MESQSKKIIDIIEKILPLLKMTGGASAIYYHDFLIYILGQLNKPHNLEKIAENILKTYGGMATFSDVTLYKDGQYLDKENDVFDDLRTDLFLKCEEIVIKTRQSE